MSFFIAVSSIERALMVAVCLLAVIVELFNSAIEAVLDRISLEKTILNCDSGSILCKGSGAHVSLLMQAPLFLSLFY